MRAERLAFRPASTLPGGLIVGAAQTGTGALFDALSGHTEIRPALRKAVHFADRHWVRGRDWYARNFPQGKGVGLEATTNYLYFPRAAQRMASTVPDAKIIAILRDPVARAREHHRLAREQGIETRSFEDAIAVEDEHQFDWDIAVGTGNWPQTLERYSYLRRGLYGAHLTRWLSHFPEDQILVLEDRDLYERPSHAIGKICDFLGISRQSLTLTCATETRREPRLSEARLYYRFEEDGKLLTAAFGDRFSWLK